MAALKGLIFAFAVFLSSSAFASFSGVCTNSASCYTWTSSNNVSISGTVEAVCAYEASRLVAFGWPGVGTASVVGTLPALSCLTPTGYGPNTAVPNHTLHAASCPAGSTLSGTTCTCNAPKIEQIDGVGAHYCVAVADAPNSYCVDMANTGKYWMQYPLAAGENGLSGPSAAVGVYLCDPAPASASGITTPGCAMVVAYEIGIPGFYKGGYGRYTGKGCTPGTGDGSTDATAPSLAASAPPAGPGKGVCKPGFFMGTVNGVTDCYGSSNFAVAVPMTAASGVGSLPVGAPSTATNSTTSTSVVGVTATTVTQYFDASGAKVGETTATGTKAGYCSQNPSAAVCADSQPPGLCAEYPDIPACKKQYDLGTVALIPVVNTPINMAISADTGWGPSAGGACPAPRTITVLGGKTLSFSFQYICNFANMIRPIVIGLAWLTAALTFLGFGRKA